MSGDAVGGQLFTSHLMERHFTSCYDVLLQDDDDEYYEESESDDDD